jgi:hypothetical protein
MQLPIKPSDPKQVFDIVLRPSIALPSERVHDFPYIASPAEFNEVAQSMEDNHLCPGSHKI